MVFLKSARGRQCGKPTSCFQPHSRPLLHFRTEERVCRLLFGPDFCSREHPAFGKRQLLTEKIDVVHMHAACRYRDRSVKLPLRSSAADARMGRGRGRRVRLYYGVCQRSSMQGGEVTASKTTSSWEHSGPWPRVGPSAVQHGRKLDGECFGSWSTILRSEVFLSGYVPCFLFQNIPRMSWQRKANISHDPLLHDRGSELGL